LKRDKAVHAPIIMPRVYRTYEELKPYCWSRILC